MPSNQPTSSNLLVSAKESREALASLLPGLRAPQTTRAIRIIRSLFALELEKNVHAQRDVLMRASMELQQLSASCGPFDQQRLDAIVEIMQPAPQASRVDPLEVVVDKANDNNFFTGLTGEISDGGLFVATHNVLPVGTRVALKVYLPEGTLKALGQVSWVRKAPGGMGIRMTDLNLAEQEPVLRWLATTAPLSE